MFNAAIMNDTERLNNETKKFKNIPVISDVSNASVSKAFEQTLAKHGKIDVLVNNAGVSGFGLFEAYSIARIKELFEVNFYGVVRTYQAVLPGMRKAKSRLIINLTSGASGHTMPFMIPYLASKFGVETITEGLEAELAQFGIESVNIQPAGINFSSDLLKI
jgi:NAD(P)-dependent dehydrogenase (short-subunit alcohol dehydrogenase family)